MAFNASADRGLYPTLPQARINQSMKNISLRLAISLSAIAFLSACNTGVGVNASLDISNGFDVNYQASLATAWAKMTPLQQEAFNWAIDDVSAGNLVAKFGKSPSPKQIVEDETRKSVALTMKERDDLQKVVDGMRDKIADRERKRSEAVDMLKSLSGTAEYVDSVTLRANWQKYCENSCSGWMNLNVFTYTSNPKRIPLGEINCKGQYEIDGKTYEESLSCSPGKRFKGTAAPEGFRSTDLNGKTMTLTFDPYSARDLNGDRLVPPRFAEVVRLEGLESFLLKLKKYQAAVQ